MKKITHRYIWFAVFLLGFYFARPVFAHGSEPRLEINPERLNPGAILEIRGVDFEVDEQIILILVGSQSETGLSTVAADADGVFLLSVSLPTDLVEGTYLIHATTDDHSLDSPPFTVWGSASLGGNEEGQRTDEEGLLAPMPTTVPEVVSGNGAPKTMPGLSRSPILIALPVFLIVGVFVLLGLKIVQKK